MSFVKIDEFSARYSGPAVDDHTMDVSALGPALLGMGEIFREAYAVIAPMDDSCPTVKVQEVRPGSFEIALGVDLSLIEEAVNLFTGNRSTALANASGIAGGIVGVVTAAIALFKREATTGKRFSRDELVTELRDELLAQHIDHLRDRRHFRQNVGRVVKPLTEDGIDEVTFFDRQGADLVSVSETEAEKIAEFEPEVQPTIRYEDAVVEIGTPQISKPLKRKWGLLHSQYGSINAALLDTDFADEVFKSKVSFATGKRFKTKLRVEESPIEADSEPSRSFEIVEIEPLEEGEQSVILFGE